MFKEIPPEQTLFVPLFIQSGLLQMNGEEIKHGNAKRGRSQISQRPGSRQVLRGRRPPKAPELPELQEFQELQEGLKQSNILSAIWLQK